MLPDFPVPHSDHSGCDCQNDDDNGYEAHLGVGTHTFVVLAEKTIMMRNSMKQPSLSK